MRIFGSKSKPDRSGPPPDLVERVKELLKKGDKIDAIKELREATGSGLKEAKDAVDAIEQGRDIHLISQSDALLQKLRSQYPESLIEQVKAILLTGNRVHAIKVFMEEAGVGLRDGKDAVDAIATEL